MSRNSAMYVTPAMEISSNPSAPWTTEARFTPSSPSARAMSSVRLASYTPTICAEAPAGFVSGPRRLKTVRMRKVAASRHRVARGRMHSGSKKKTNTHLFNHARNPPYRRRVNPHAEMFEHIG